MSMKLTPAAATSTTTWPGAATGSGHSPSTIASGPPTSLTTIARIASRPFTLVTTSSLSRPRRLDAADLRPDPVSGRTLYGAAGDVAAKGVTPAARRAEMEPMPTMPRCVVTGHDASGNSVFTSDEPVPAAHTTPGGTLFYELWATDAAPAPINAGPVNAGPGGAGPGGAAAPDPAGGPPRGGA